jgi:1-aminocyclopropane-1-carboxylate synthase
MRSRLGAAYRSVPSALDEAGIPYLPAVARFFFLCALQQFMADQTWHGEFDFWRRILGGASVNLSPGSACRITEPRFTCLYCANP